MKNSAALFRDPSWRQQRWGAGLDPPPLQNLFGELLHLTNQGEQPGQTVFLQEGWGGEREREMRTPLPTTGGLVHHSEVF